VLQEWPMVRCAARLCLLSALAACLVACSSDKKQAEENPNVFPADYKNEILVTLTNTLDDPTNIRSASITDPFVRLAGKEERYLVCMRFDARNLNRHYTGITERVAIFYGGHLNQVVDATKEQCGNAAYKPFPELEKLCQAKKCE
jgi:hypothetical protein